MYSTFQAGIVNITFKGTKFENLRMKIWILLLFFNYISIKRDLINLF